MQESETNETYVGTSHHQEQCALELNGLVDLWLACPLCSRQAPTTEPGVFSWRELGGAVIRARMQLQEVDDI